MAKVELFTGRRVRVRIDLNSRTPEGLVRARTSNADGPLWPGAPVVVYEPEDGVAAAATVNEVDEEWGFAYLDVDWGSLDDDDY